MALLRAMVGGVVSAGGVMVRLTLLLASPPSWLKLPAASLKALLPTLMLALVAPTPGVKVAV